MSDVCSEEAQLQDWHLDGCWSLAGAVISAMSVDAARNREHFDPQAACARLWTQLQGDAKVQVEKERAVRKAAEERARLEEEAAEKERAAQAAAEAKAAEERA